MDEKKFGLNKTRGPKAQEPEKSDTDNFHIETIDANEARRVLNKVEIHGDEFKGEYLTFDILSEEGLLPWYKIRLGDSIVWFSSSAYKLDEGRVAVVAYVEKGGNITARSYYLSRSHGVWRYLPDYRMDENGEIDQYGKGYNEDSLRLPIASQKALAEITREGVPILELKRDPNIVFLGTANKKWQSEPEYYREIEDTPKKFDEFPYVLEGKIQPELARLTEEQTPDFSRLLTSWQQWVMGFGKISNKVFPSRDGKLKFIFCKDADGRAWISGVEDDSEVQSTGLKKSWVYGGDLFTPPFEYKSGMVDETGGYGNEKIRRGDYVDMFEKYLRKIPVIQEYLFAELYQDLEKKGGLQGTSKLYSAIELRNIIERVRRGELDSAYITRTGGLREKVEYLLK